MAGALAILPRLRARTSQYVLAATVTVTVATDTNHMLRSAQVMVMTVSPVRMR